MKITTTIVFEDCRFSDAPEVAGKTKLWVPTNPDGSLKFITPEQLATIIEEYQRRNQPGATEEEKE